MCCNNFTQAVLLSFTQTVYLISKLCSSRYNLFAFKSVEVQTTNSAKPFRD